MKKASSVTTRLHVGLVARLWDYSPELARNKGEREEVSEQSHVAFLCWHLSKLCNCPLLYFHLVFCWGDKWDSKAQCAGVCKNANQLCSQQTGREGCPSGEERRWGAPSWEPEESGWLREPCQMHFPPRSFLLWPLLPGQGEDTKQLCSCVGFLCLFVFHQERWCGKVTNNRMEGLAMRWHVDGMWQMLILENASIYL